MSNLGIVLTLYSFRPLEDPSNADLFFGLLEKYGGIFVPEGIEGDRKRPYPKGQAEVLRAYWKPSGFILTRRQPIRVTTSLTLLGETERRQGHVPQSLFMWIDADRFAGISSLSELLHFGGEMYGFFSPYYGFIEIPHLKNQGAAGQLTFGFPGFGWATWLGPEYAEFLPIPPIKGVASENLPDGGRLLVLEEPANVTEPEPGLRRAHQELVASIPGDKLQAPMPPVGRGLASLIETLENTTKVVESRSGKRVPTTFRYLDKPMRAWEPAREQSMISPDRLYEPPGFTRADDVCAILDPLEFPLVEGELEVGGTVRFEGLSGAEASRLLAVLPADQAAHSLENSPTFRQFAELAAEFPAIRLFGYRIVPDREDERISIQGLYVPKRDLARALVSRLRRDYPRPEFARWEDHGGEKYFVVKWE